MIQPGPGEFDDYVDDVMGYWEHLSAEEIERIEEIERRKKCKKEIERQENTNASAESG